uniref:Protein kinase domain-containing protein n=1 Tax=Loa loa TaxID=7209 RepID=A0A1I7VZI1_LOALO
MKNADLGMNAPNGLIIPEKVNNDKVKGDNTPNNSFTTVNANSEAQDGNATDTENDYDADFEMKKNPELDESEMKKDPELDKSEMKEISESGESEMKKNSELDESEVKKNSELDESEVKKNPELDESEVKKNPELNESEMKKNPELDESEMKNIPELDENEMKNIPELDKNDEETENTTQSSISDLKEVVTTLNLSEAQTATFVRIIEKIVDEELKRRHDEEGSKLKFIETSEKPKLAAANSYELNSESKTDDRYEEEIRPHEKLTVNTRLSFNDQHIIDDYRNVQEEIPEALAAESLKLDSRKQARKKADYVAREQAEYDRLISGITDTTPRLESDYLETKADQGANQRLIRTTVKSISTEEAQTSTPTGLQPEKVGLQPVERFYIPNRTTIIYGKVTSFPRTVFERQAEDFRIRLLGMNGFGDIIKALKHAKIGTD